MLWGWLQGKNQPVPLLREVAATKLLRETRCQHVPGYFLLFLGGNFPSQDKLARVTLLATSVVRVQLEEQISPLIHV